MRLTLYTIIAVSTATYFALFMDMMKTPTIDTFITSSDAIYNSGRPAIMRDMSATLPAIALAAQAKLRVRDSNGNSSDIKYLFTKILSLSIYFAPPELGALLILNYVV